MDDGEFHDFKIIMDDVTFNVHRFVLAKCSDVFKNMFSVEMKEKAMNEVTIATNDPDKNFNDPKSMRILLEWMYHETISEKNFKPTPLRSVETIGVLALASKYNVQAVVNHWITHNKSVSFIVPSLDPILKYVGEDRYLEQLRAVKCAMSSGSVSYLSLTRPSKGKQLIHVNSYTYVHYS